MKIVIHGTKGGHHTFTDEKVEMIDARPDSSKVAAIGREAYAINFNDGNVVFSKYKIVRDVAGEKRTGHIAFSVIIPNEKKLSGSNVKLLLDELAEDYCRKYIENNNLDNVREDWQFIEKISNKFIKNIYNVSTRAIENFQQGTEEAAFIYYSSDDDLQNYFDAPYQDNYKRFKQIFFVEEKFESKPENPLNALRHNPSNNLTRRINVRNRKYTLLFDEKNIKVKENGAERKNDSRVHIESEFEIVYFERYYETIKVAGLIKEIEDYVSIDSKDEIITIQKRDLKPIEYTFNFITTDQNSNLIDDTEIIGKRSDQSQEVLVNPFVATYETSKGYIVYAKKDPDLISVEKFLKDYFISGDPPTSIEIKLFLKKRPKEINIIVQDENEQSISRFSIVNEKYQDINVSSDNKIVFSGEERNRNIQITVNCEGYESSKLKFIPEDKESITIKLKKRNVSPNDKQTEIQYTSHEKKYLRGKKFLIIVFVLLLIILCGFYFYLNGESKIETEDEIQKSFEGAVSNSYDQDSLAKVQKALEDASSNSSYLDSLKEVQKYLEGTIIDLRYLDSLEKKFCKPKSSIADQALGIQSDKRPTICTKVDTTITICRAIKKGSIDTLKQIRTYSSKQGIFKNVIYDVKEKYKNQIGNSLKNRYSSDSVVVVYLDNVANFIDSVQNSLIVQEQQQNSSNKGISSSSSVKTIAEQKSSNKGTSSSSQTKAVATSGSFETNFLELIKKVDGKNQESVRNEIRDLCEKQKDNVCINNKLLYKITKKGDGIKVIANIAKIDQKERREIKSLSELEKKSEIKRLLEEK